MGRWKALGGPRRRLVGCLADVANTANTWPMGKEPRRRERDEKIPQTKSAGSAARNLSSTSWIASNSSDRLRHVPKYFSISSINRPAVFNKKKLVPVTSGNIKIIRFTNQILWNISLFKYNEIFWFCVFLAFHRGEK